MHEFLPKVTIKSTERDLCDGGHIEPNPFRRKGRVSRDCVWLNVSKINAFQATPTAHHIEMAYKTLNQLPLLFLRLAA